MTEQQFTIGIVGLGLIGGIIKALGAYRTALLENDARTLTALLREGRLAKENADKDGDE
jgi:hypothetical protein